MSAVAHKPAAHSLAQRVITWLKNHPELEGIDLDTISDECDAVRGNIHTLLRTVVIAGVLLRTEEASGEYLYRRGPKFFGADPTAEIASVFKPRLVSPPAPVVVVDLATVPIDDNVPLQRHSGPAQDYGVLLRRMTRPGQSAPLPARLRRTVTKAIQEWHKTNPGRYGVRKDTMHTIRVFRLE